MEIETEVVAGVTVGRLTLETRRGLTEFSRSMGLRLGEELEECVPSMRSEVLRRAESMVEEFGTEDDMAFELEVLDKFTVGEPCGLRPLLCGVMVSAFVQIAFDFEGVELIFLRPGVDGLDGVVRLVGDVDWAPFSLEGDGSAPRIASYSGGMGTL